MTLSVLLVALMLVRDPLIDIIRPFSGLNVAPIGTGDPLIDIIRPFILMWLLMAQECLDFRSSQPLLVNKVFIDDIAIFSEKSCSRKPLTD